jgi:hypothetical protein
MSRATGWARSNGSVAAVEISNAIPNGILFTILVIADLKPVAGEETWQLALQAVDRETRERFERTWLDLGSAPSQRRVLAALANSPRSLYSGATLQPTSPPTNSIQPSKLRDSAIGWGR